MSRPPKHLVEHNGELVTLHRLWKRTGIPVATLTARYHRGQRGAALTRPVLRHPALNTPPGVYP